MAAELFEGKQKGTVLIHDGQGHLYHVDKQREDVVHLKCANRKCRGRCRTRPPLIDGCELVSVRDHDHDADVPQIRVLQLKKKLLIRSERETLPLKTIFQQEWSRAPLEVASRLKYDEVYSSMYKRRRTSQVTLPSPMLKRMRVTQLATSSYEKKKEKQRKMRGTLSAVPASYRSFEETIPRYSTFLTKDVEAGTSGEDSIADFGVLALNTPSGKQDARYRRYRTFPTVLKEGLVIDERLIEVQKEELQDALLIEPIDEPSFEADDAQPVCNICLVNTATRMAVPCGHYVVCRACLPEFISQVNYLKVNGQSETIVATPIRVPITCPECRAIVGQVIMPFR